MPCGTDADKQLLHSQYRGERRVLVHLDVHADRSRGLEQYRGVVGDTLENGFQQVESLRINFALVESEMTAGIRGDRGHLLHPLARHQE